MYFCYLFHNLTVFTLNILASRFLTEILLIKKSIKCKKNKIKKTYFKKYIISQDEFISV